MSLPLEETMNPDQSFKPRRQKSREVSSRFLPPSSTPTHDLGTPSQNQAMSPIRQNLSTPPDARKHRSLEVSSGFVRRLWPSNSTTSNNSSSSHQSSNKNHETLAEFLGNERLNDYLEQKKEDKSSKSSVFSLSRQRSCREVSKSENEITEKESAKENHRPILGGSTRYTGRLRFPGKSPSSSSNSLSRDSGVILPGRFSVDGNSLHRKSHPKKSDPFLDNLAESESSFSDVFSSTDFSSPAISRGSSQSFRKSGVEVSSKYLQDLNRPRRLNSDSNIQHPVSLDTSPRLNKFTLKNAIKRTNSLAGYASATSQWALSPGRSGSPPMSVESKQRPMSFSSLKPPNSPSRAKGVEKLLNFGLDLFKNKKTSSSSSPSPLGPGDAETVHQLRMLHNRFMQWRYANARGNAVNENITNQVENNLVYAWDGFTKLRHSVIQKKLQLQKKKLEMKLDFILLSQMKLLESWGEMERQHLSSISMTKDCLHSVVCRVPLIEGAKVNQQSASIAIRHVSDLSASIKSMLASFSPSANNTASLVSELAEVVAQEKLLIDECLELSKTNAMLEIQERSLKCYIIQFEAWQQLQQHEKQEEEISLDSIEKLHMRTEIK